MKNLLILPNAIGDIILSSELIKYCAAKQWVILVKQDFFRWVNTYLNVESSFRLTHFLDVENDYKLVIDLCGQDDTISHLQRVRFIGRLIGCYSHHIYDLKLNFKDLASNSSVFHYYEFLQKKMFGVIPLSSYPSNPIFSEKEYDLMIYPFSGNKNKDWDIDNFISVYKYFKRKGKVVKFLNPIPCDRNIESIDASDVVKTSDWNDSTEQILKSHILLTNDSSIGHIGAFLGVYTIALFILNDPKLWFPYPNNVGFAMNNAKNIKDDVIINILQDHIIEIN